MADFKYIKSFDYRLYILAGGRMTSAMGFALSIPFLAIYFHSSLGISMSSIGIFFGIAAIVRGLTFMMGGELSDKFGRHPLMVIGQIARSTIFILMAASIYYNQGFLLLAGLVLVNSIFGSFFQPSANAMVADLVDTNRRNEAYAIMRIAGNVGWAVGPAAGGFLAEESYALLFLLSGIMVAISGTIIAIFLRGVKPRKKIPEKFHPRFILMLVKDRLIFQHIVLMIIMYIIIAQFMAPFSLYAVDYVGIEEKQLGILFGVNGIMVALFQLPVTRMLRKYRLTVQIILGAALYIIGYMMIGLFPAFAWFILAFVIFTTGELFVSPPGMSIAANLAPEGREGRYMGFYGLALTLGWSLGPMVGGALLDLTKPDFIIAWAIMAGANIIVLLGFINLTPKIPHEKNIQTENQ